MANDAEARDPIQGAHSQPLTLLCSSDCTVLDSHQVAPEGRLLTTSFYEGRKLRPEASEGLPEIPQQVDTGPPLFTLSPP